MSTNASIAVKMSDGSIKQVYCHHDGYIDGVGAILKEHYNNQERAEALISLGDMSSLGSNITPSGPHSWSYPEDDVTVYYCRDRGEDDVEPAVFSDFASFMRSGDMQQYNYLFLDGRRECMTWENDDFSEY